MPAFAFALALATQVQARVISPNSLPMEVRRAVAEVNQLCKESGGRPGKSSSLIKFVDLTGDGVIDYVMDLQNYECEGAAAGVGGGQSGNAITVFAGGPGNTAKKAYQTVAYGVTVEPRGGAQMLYVQFAGVDCGQRKGVKSGDIQACERPLHWNAATQMFVLGPMSEKRAVR